MKSSRVRFSLRRKIALIIIVMAVLLSGVALFVSQRTFSQTNDERYRAQATNLARTISAVVDGDLVEALHQEVAAIYDSTEEKVGSEDMGTPEYDAYIANFADVEHSGSYQALYGVLRGIQDSNDVESVYILYVDVPTRKTVYLVDASDDPCPPGNFDPVYEQNYPVLKSPEVGFPAYITNTPEYGWLVSAAVPIYTSGGQVAGYAFADISMNEVKNAENRFLITLSVLMLETTIALCVIYILIANRILVKPINQLSKAASTYYDSDTKTKTSFANLSIRTRDEIGALSTAMKQMERDMNAYIHDLTAVTAEKERIGAELSIATQIQADMLPRIFPAFPDRHDFDIYATMDPAKEVGGDFYDFFLIDDDHLCMVMADVSGKGVPAALFMVIAKTLIKNQAQTGKSPAEILANVNSQLCDGNEAELFVTVWLAILELSTGKGVAANAGHEHPTICRKDGQYELVVYRHSLAVAAMEGVRFRQHEFQLHPGDRLFVYTDGVPEATDADGKMFGAERMLAALNQDPAAPPEKLLRTVRREIDAFAGNAPQFDDITMLGLYYQGREPQLFELKHDEARIDQLDKVLAFVDGILESLDCPMKTQMQIDVAVEELYVNIASYAYAPAAGPVTIRVDVAPDRHTVEITFIDSGVPYDPLQKPDPDVTLPSEERQIGGLGIFMVKKSMDDMRYSYVDGQNRLTISKRI